ncbi:SDR family oxidoreductase [Pseudomonas sp. RIT-PI-S]|uniref:SDR family NAD(P)-dependent oxidoreductase n=1 Tax=Pseudomonas sp. RIT-PI-S TaxID=3035295 RepID=UPI0021D9F4BA|nr:SDR family oxidoreductase [Pseudomonas sp. RIT-PI-S]
MTLEHHANPTAKIAIITGGSRGIGRSTVLNLAKRGVHSIFTYHSNQAQANEVVGLVTQAGAKAIALQLDTAQAGLFDGFAQQVQASLRELGASRFDYLVNNAGTSSNSSFANTTEAELDALFAVHFKGVFLLTQRLVPLMHDGGRIVNISSGLARFAMPNRAAYGSIKAAVESLTRYMAVELAPRRIAANVIAPGAIATDFSGGVVRDNAEVNKLVASNTALGRVGLPEDVGPVIAGLLSNEFSWINAQRIEVAGGVHI